MKSKGYCWRLFFVVFAVAFVVNFGVGLKLGIGKKAESDAYYYLQLARGLSEEQAYVIRDGFWPDAPSMRRLPAWPFLISITLRLFPGLSPDILMRVLCLLLNSLVASMIFLVTWHLFQELSAAVVAGIFYAIHPAGLYFAYNGLSEPMFILLVASGLCLLLVRCHHWRAAGVLFLGCSCLVRANFILWIVFVALITGVRWLACRSRRVGGKMHRDTDTTCLIFPGRRQVAIGILGVILFVFPVFLWALRNYQVCGHFPVISTLGGAAFYGGNNPVVADTMEYWGYWVFPNRIPGERPMAELAKTMSEYEVDDYYFGKGREYIRQNWFSMPRLLLGKLIRAYVPVPWKPRWGSYAVSAYRLLIYIGAVIGIFVGWKKAGVVYDVSLLAMVLTSLVTVLVFWGYARFAFALEPFLLPFLGVGIVHIMKLIADNCKPGGESHL